MDFKFPNSKKLYLAIEITQLLHDNECTYNEADEIMKLLTDEYKQQRECGEYDTLIDYFSGNKTRCLDDEIVSPLNHVPPYC